MRSSILEKELDALGFDPISAKAYEVSIKVSDHEIKAMLKHLKYFNDTKLFSLIDKRDEWLCALKGWGIDLPDEEILKPNRRRSHKYDYQQQNYISPRNHKQKQTDCI